MLSSLLYSIFGIFGRQVRIGFNDNMDKKQRHGVVWVKSAEGGIQPQSFVVDNPQHLESPSNLTVSSIFYQVSLMGFFPVNLEIITKKERTMYEFGKIRPVFVQSA